MAPAALAFCRTTTCDVEAERMPPECVPDQRDENLCSLKGAQLFWPVKCISFGVQEDGSKKLGIGWEVTDSLVATALGRWSHVDCGGGRLPSLEVYDLDRDSEGRPQPMVCPVVEFNKSGPNANIWMFSDDEWPYPNAVLALTTITFDETGRILDADVELNSFATDLTTPDAPHVGSDLQSIVTHEAGHFLGLAHETLRTATMNPEYRQGMIDFRTLEPDDVAGVCAIYPPNRAAECPVLGEPLHGFSRYCGGEEDTSTVRSGLSKDERSGCACSLDHSSGRVGGSVWLLLTAAAGLSRRRFTKTMRGSHD